MRNIQLWNVIAMGRYVCAVAKKKYNLCIKWVCKIYVKESRRWEFDPPTHSSWYWRKVCKENNLLKNVLSEVKLIQM